ncbi:MAG: hypothetical protein R3C56_16420 [Pirellulaceae bacterium]
MKLNPQPVDYPHHNHSAPMHDSKAASMRYQLHQWPTCGLLACLIGCLLASPTSAQSPTWDKYFELEVARIEAASAADLASVTKANWDEKNYKPAR